MLQMNIVRRYLRSEEGAVLPLIGLAITVLIGMMGLAIDIGRAQIVHAKLLNAADAGGLAAGARLNSSMSGTLQQEVEKYVKANFPDGYVDSHVTSVTARANSTDTTINVTAEATMPTTFVRLFGYKTITVKATSEITREIGGLEVVMVLDNTGSMGGSKLSSLKSAAKDLVEILFGDNSSEHLFVGLVPFSQAVNIGTTHKTWLNIDVDDQSKIDFGQSVGGSWGGCVEARLDGDDVTDEPPVVDETVTPKVDTRFTPYLWPDGSDNDWKNESPTGHYERRCTMEWFGYCFRYENVWVQDGASTTYNTPFSTNRGPNKSCSQPVTPMTQSETTITNAINGMQAVGNTHINLGAVWGWRMLSPKWRDFWGGEMTANSLPLDYNNELMDKAIIIMTDGDNTWGTDYSAYGPRSEARLGTSNTGYAADELDDRLEEVCTDMKNVGIIVYTIAFGNPGNSTKSMMRRCATQSDFFFDSPSSSDLSAAFKEIGDSLSNLRVSR